MNTHANKTQENKSQSVSAVDSQMQSGGESTFQFVDNRPEAVAQKKLQEITNNSPRAIQLKAIKEMANISPQAKQAAQLQTMADGHSVQQQQPIQKKENNTGLPDNLKTGSGGPMPADVQAKMESAFGTDFSDVQIREGPEASSIGAVAFTRGNELHFAPGQYDPRSQSGQKLLGHELAHVVQQREGRVRPTTQAKGLAVNADPTLEREADEMGARAVRGDVQTANLDARRGPGPAPGAPVQRWIDPWSFAALAAISLTTLGIAEVMRRCLSAAEDTDDGEGSGPSEDGPKKKSRRRRKKRTSGKKKVPLPAKGIDEKEKQNEGDVEFDAEVGRLLDAINELSSAAGHLGEEETAPLLEVLEEAESVLNNAAGKDDLERVLELLAASRGELDAIYESFETVGKEQRDWSVNEFEQATGGRKGKFGSLVAQGLIRGGGVCDEYCTSYEKLGGFATAITIFGSEQTEIHTHYDAKDQLLQAHFKPSAERYQKGHALNSLRGDQLEEFVHGPMQTKYGNAPWGKTIKERKK
jgi:hypothetical protein